MWMKASVGNQAQGNCVAGVHDHCRLAFMIGVCVLCNPIVVCMHVLGIAYV